MSAASAFRTILGTAAIAALAAAATPAAGQSPASQTITVGPSGLPLPRFVSLKAGRVNLRIGPGRNYSVDWLYLKSGVPMEIVQEFDNWRRVRDSEGTEGWINQSLLSGRRTAVAAPWQRGKGGEVPLLADPSADARPVALVEPGAIGTIRACDGEWCRMTFDGHTGWIAQAQIWGAYPGEAVED